MLRELSILTFASLFMACVLSSLGCSGSEQTHEADEVSFGLPGKGDATCDDRSPLCWLGSDSRYARDLMDAESDVLLGHASLSTLIDAITPLEHKLTDVERSALSELLSARDEIARDEQGGEVDDQRRRELIRDAFERVYGRALSGYWTAHSTLIAEAVMSDAAREAGALEEERASDKADDDGVSGALPQAVTPPRSLRPAFEELWSRGPFGQYLVMMLTLSGVSGEDWVVTPIHERAVARNRPIDRDAESLVNSYARYAALESFFTGLQSLIPVAGIWISVPYGVYAQFKQRARLSFELATLYGLDVKDPDDFLVTVQLMITAQGFKELFSSAYRALMGAQGYRMIAGKGGNDYLVGEDEFSDRRVGELVKLNLAQLGVYGARFLAVIQARATGQSARALLGQLTFGVTLLAEITIDYFTVASFGRELRALLHPWGWATYLESMTPLEGEPARRCAHAALMEVARADGVISAYEADMMVEALIRPFHSEDTPPGARSVTASYARDQSWVAFLDPEHLLTQVRVARAEPLPLDCLADTWAAEPTLTQLSLLSWIELMAHSDGSLDEAEERWLSELAHPFSVYHDEARVYGAMRDRVASQVGVAEEPTLSLWMWGGYEFDELERLMSASFASEVGALMR